MENTDQLFPKIKGRYTLTKSGIFKLIELSKKFESVEVFRTTNGFISTYVLNDGTESFLYRSEEEMKDHFKKSRNFKLWEFHFEKMAENTIQKMHLLQNESKSREIIYKEFRKIDL